MKPIHWFTAPWQLFRVLKHFVYDSRTLQIQDKTRMRVSNISNANTVNWLPCFWIEYELWLESWLEWKSSVCSYGGFNQKFYFLIKKKEDKFHSRHKFFNLFHPTKRYKFKGCGLHYNVRSVKMSKIKLILSTISAWNSIKFLEPQIWFAVYQLSWAYEWHISFLFLAKSVLTPRMTSSSFEIYSKFIH